MKLRNRTKLVYGVGINNADYQIKQVINGKQTICPFYRKWQSMLMRCYSTKFQENRPSYISCTVSEDWHTFSNFKAWMEKQDWKGNDLDKDLLFQGNKIYSADTCVFISPQLNKLLLTSDASRGEYAIGVSFKKDRKQFQAMCSENGKNKCLGHFLTELEAARCYTAFKNELYKIESEKQTDIRLKTALLARII